MSRIKRALAELRRPDPERVEVAAVVMVSAHVAVDVDTEALARDLKKLVGGWRDGANVEMVSIVRSPLVGGERGWLL